MILLDSSILIELFRKKDKKKTLFYNLSQSDKDLSISTLNVKHFERIKDLELLK
jgi:predicted nucleic acid-binding protein